MPNAAYKIQSDLEATDLMNTIIDFESYPEFVDTVEKVEIRVKGPPVWEVYFEIRVIRKLTYVLRLEQKSEHEICWSLVEGFFLKNEGAWQLSPNEEGTEIHYSVSTKMDTFLPTMIRKSLSNQLLPKVIDAFVTETRARLALKRIDSSDN